MIRPSQRKNNEMRKVSLELGYAPYAEGSCMVRFGNTHVLCSARIEERVPPFLRNSGKGWVTAEYGMLPCSTHSRVEREAARGKQSGRTQEIQRLIGRSLRICIDEKKLGERQIRIDCDVINADGGTRVASICGGYMALRMACNYLMHKNMVKSDPIITQIAAISCGIYMDECILDLDYDEDSNVAADANFVLTNDSEIVEIQTTAEKKPFNGEQFTQLFNLAATATQEIVQLQNDAFSQYKPNYE